MIAAFDSATHYTTNRRIKCHKMQFNEHCLLVGESSYVLQDASGELELKCSLQESLRRARTRPLFTVSLLELKYRIFIILLC